MPLSSFLSVKVSRSTSEIWLKGYASWLLIPNALDTKPTIVSKT